MTVWTVVKLRVTALVWSPRPRRWCLWAKKKFIKKEKSWTESYDETLLLAHRDAYQHTWHCLCRSGWLLSRAPELIYVLLKKSSSTVITTTAPSPGLSFTLNRWDFSIDMTQVKPLWGGTNRESHARVCVCAPVVLKPEFLRRFRPYLTSSRSCKGWVKSDLKRLKNRLLTTGICAVGITTMRHFERTNNVLTQLPPPYTKQIPPPTPPPPNPRRLGAVRNSRVTR